MNEHLYKLEPYKGMKTRYSCPSCQQYKVFALYIDTETGEHLNESVGRCNREINCGYHYSPKQYFEENNISFDKSQQHRQQRAVEQLPPKQISLISVEVFTASLQSHESNNFVRYLIELFGVEVTNGLIAKYFIGTSKYWNGATVFWQIDKEYQVRTGKIMLNSPTTGKRVKEPFNHINWVHKALKLPDFELKQCLFGEHLLNDNSKPIALCESEKTAIVASVYLPDFIWLAAGGISNLTADKCKVLSGRTVYLYPDLNGFEKWSIKAKELSHIATIVVSDLLERHASDEERKEGLDLEDYLIRFDYKDFIEPEPPAPPPPPAVEVEMKEPITVKANESNDLKERVLDWSKEVEELETYFKSVTLPTVPISISQGETINNVGNFLESHFATLKHMKGKRVFLPHLHRLQKLKSYLTQGGAGLIPSSIK
ncbi:DUF6965 family protein [Emticicia sp.]|uniref:DUF6965 family protein n=1 Tax=Emticicia sp. TaxID=1930953 RepID=UPI0037502769